MAQQLCPGAAQSVAAQAAFDAVGSRHHHRTAAVISLMAFGKGSMEDALEDIRRQGTTNVIVRSVKPMDETTSQRRSWVVNYGLTWDDYDRCKMLETVIGEVPMRVFPQEVRRRDRVYN